ncbi:MAG: MarR family transcriptional regulator [Armatimonadota bacterium]|nr:MarR family transcriptional regulator [Armatimonadota bacterium]
MIDQEALRQAAEIVDLAPRMMRRLFALDAEDPTTELPLAQLRLCGILRQGPLTMSAISRELGVSLSATTQLADRLENSGLVERACESGDRRIKLLRLTPDGERIMRARREKRVACAAEALGQLPRATRERLLSALRESVES